MMADNFNIQKKELILSEVKMYRLLLTFKLPIGIIFFIFLTLETSFSDQLNKNTYIPQTLTITEIQPSPPEGKYAWIEFCNTSNKTINVAGYKIGVNGKFNYDFPTTQIIVKQGWFIVLHFDGEGYENKMKVGKESWNNNDKKVIHLHSPSGAVEILNPRAGQISLYENKNNESDNLIDFVRWGKPKTTECLNSPINRIWKPHWFIPTMPNFGDYDPSFELQKGYSIGLYPIFSPNTPNNWAIFSGDETTMGMKSTIPAPKSFSLPNETVVCSKDISVFWNGDKHAKNYVFKLSKDENINHSQEFFLESPHFIASKELAEGIYYYKVKSVIDPKNESSWSHTMQFESKKKGRPIKEEYLKNMRMLFQKKDTKLLCLEGCQSELIGSDRRWDHEHPDYAHINNDHGKNNCARASISMMVSNYQKRLSQDRISYFTSKVRSCFRNGFPEDDLAHSSPMTISEETATLEWALGTRVKFYEEIKPPSFKILLAYLKDRRPVMTRVPTHMRVINGACIDENDVEWVYILDPKSGFRCVEYNSWVRYSRGTWVGPIEAPNARGDEMSVWADSDGDGVMDFDELKRFETDPFKSDTDYDGVNDKNDIREYVFSSQNEYLSRPADFDTDCLRKELDPDNDNDGFLDGEEDKNGNGRLERNQGETSNFQRNFRNYKRHESQNDQNTKNNKIEINLFSFDSNDSINWIAIWNSIKPYLSFQGIEIF
jgi:Lamin Tail Domain